MISSKPTAEEKVQYTAWLTEAEAALHEYMVGESAVTVSYDGESTTFRAANINQLKSYINDLRRALGKTKTANRGFSFKPVVFGRR